MSELPDMDELLRNADRREGKSLIIVGALLLIAGVGMSFFAASMLGGQVIWGARSSAVLGLVLLVRGLQQRAK